MERDIASRLKRGSWPGVVAGLAALFLGTAVLADEPDFKSSPVSWTFLKAEGNSLALDGVFTIELKGDVHWRRRPMTTSSTGYSLNKWDIVDEKDAKQGTFSVMDFALAKMPDSKQSAFIRKVAAAVQKSEDAVIVQSGFVETDTAVTSVDAKWPHSLMAVSKFVREGENRVNITYFFPAAHLFFLNFTGPAEAEPQWFSDTWQSLEAPSS